MKQEQEYAKRTEIPNDMRSAVNALREALHDNPCVILDGKDRFGKDRHYFFSDPDLFKALKAVVPFLPKTAKRRHRRRERAPILTSTIKQPKHMKQGAVAG